MTYIEDIDSIIRELEETKQVIIATALVERLEEILTMCLDRGIPIEHIQTVFEVAYDLYSREK